MKLLHVAGIFVSFTSISLEARFLEQQLSQGVTLWEVEKSTCEKQTQIHNTCTILNLHCPDNLLSLSELINEIVASNMDMVCIQGMNTIKNAYDICKALQENYSHFLYADPMQKNKSSKLLIASNHFFATDDYSDLFTASANFMIDRVFLQQDDLDFATFSDLTQAA